MDTGFQISLFLLRVFSFSLYIIIFMYSLGFAKIGGYVPITGMTGLIEVSAGES